MLKKIRLAAVLAVALLFSAPNAYAEEVIVHTESDTTYCVDDLSVAYTNMPSDVAFKAKVITYHKTYSPQSEWYFFENEEDGTVAYVVGEGGMAKTVKATDEPAYSVYNYCLKHFKKNKSSYDAAKAVLAYAEVYAYGSSVGEKEAGLLKSDVVEVRQIIVNKFRDSFQEFCLSDESLKKLTDAYMNKLKASMDISAQVKVFDAKHPVVTVAAKIADEASFESQAVNQPNVKAFALAILGLKEEGKTDADLLVDPVFQRVSVGCITDFINGLSIKQKATVDVQCKKYKAADGQVYWAPKAPETVMNFVRGK